MEIHSDRYSVKYEGRLCKHRRRRLGVEIQLIIKSSVVFDLTFTKGCLTHSRAVRKYLKLNLFARHYSHSDIRLLSGQPVQNTGFLFLGHGNFRNHFGKKLRSQAFIFFRHRHYEHASHIGASRAHRQMVRAFAEVMVGAMAAAEDDDRTESAGLV